MDGQGLWPSRPAGGLVLPALNHPIMGEALDDTARDRSIVCVTKIRT